MQMDNLRFSGLPPEMAAGILAIVRSIGNALHVAISFGLPGFDAGTLSAGPSASER